MHCKTLLSALTLLLLAGCSRVTLPPLANDHPANPEAAEAPLPPPSQSLTMKLDTSDASTGEIMTHEMEHAHQGHAENTKENTPKKVYVCPMHLDVRQSAPGRCSECGMKLKEAVYVCPMHPKVRQPRPGRCPVCRMKLVDQSKITRKGGENP